MKHSPKMLTVMTPFPYSIELGASAREAQEIMQQHGIRHLPVIDDGQVVGMLSERDMNLAIGLRLGSNEKPSLLVADVCSSDAYVVSTEALLVDVLSEMVARQLGSAIILKDYKLAGIFTTIDACEKFAEFLREQFGDPHPDDVIA